MSGAGPPAGFYERLWRDGEGAENAARRGFQDALVARALDWLGVVAGRVVLEIGPGPGRETVRLVARGARVVAVDVAPAALLRTRGAAGPAAWCVVAAAEALPLRPASVERVFAQTVLMHLDLRAAAAEWARVLVPGGRVVVLEPLRGNPLVGLYRRWLSPYRETDPRYVTLREIAGASPALSLVRHEERYLLEVAALALPGALRRPGRAVLGALDRLALRFAPLRRLAWMTLVELERRDPQG